MNRILNSFVNRIIQFRFGYTFFFSIVYLLAIFYNGYYGLSFDTNAIIIGYGVIAGKGLAGYAIDSRFNSQLGCEPGVNKNQVQDKKPEVPVTNTTVNK